MAATYKSSPMTESQASDQDGHRPPMVVGQLEQPKIPIVGPTMEDLEATMEDLLLSIRGLRADHRWVELATRAGFETATDEDRRLIRLVLRAMPGECCLMDAARLIARAAIRRAEMA